jgi:glutamyl-tRNA reductase
MNLFVVGTSYKSAPVEVREKLAVPAARLRCRGCRLKLAGELTELVVVSTCNRVEIYGVSTRPLRRPAKLFEELAGCEDTDFAPYLYVKEGMEAVKHLFAVAAGLDSLVIGETEITGQVKQAYQLAQEARLTGKVTNRLFQTALQTAKEIRTETGIGRGSTSVGSVAVDLAERIFDHDLSEKTVLIIGAGKMGEACVRHLAKKGARNVVVVNRSWDRAAALAAEFGGQAMRMDELPAALAAADIVVSSTGAQHTVLHRAELAGLMPRRRNRPLFLIDIAVPRDIDADVQELEGVYLYNVDHLDAIVRENVRHREQELARCESLITENATALMARFAQAPAPVQERTPVAAESWVLGRATACSS